MNKTARRSRVGSDTIRLLHTKNLIKRALLLKRRKKCGGVEVIEARSNVSMSLDQLTAVFGGLCLITLLIVAWPVFMGLWPILVVAVLHLMAVGWCFRRAWRNNWAREIFRIDDEKLVVVQLKAGEQKHAEWPAAWTTVKKERGHFGEPRCFLVSHGKQQQIGSFLPASEREELIEMLDQLIRPRSAWSGEQLIQVS